MYNDALEKFNRYDKRVIKPRLSYDNSQKNYQCWIRIECLTMRMPRNKNI